MSNEDSTASQILSTLNPVSVQRGVTPHSSSPERRMYIKAGAAALASGSAVYLLRRLEHIKQQKEEVQSADRLKAYANARFPILSIDPSTRDPISEERIRSSGIKPVDEASSLPQVQKVATKWRGPPPPGSEFPMGAAFDKLKEMSTQTYHPKQVAVAVLAALAGAGAGYRIADYQEEADRNEELQAELSRKRNLVDKSMFDEYARVHGLTPKELRQKKAAANPVQDFRASYGQTSPTDAPQSRNPATGLARTGEAVAWLWILGSFALAYRSSKSFYDDNDPARRRIKQLQAVAREKAKVRQAPILADASDIPDLGPNKPKTETRSIAPVDVTTSSADKTRKAVIDKSDPYASLLGG